MSGALKAGSLQGGVSQWAAALLRCPQGHGERKMFMFSMKVALPHGRPGSSVGTKTNAGISSLHILYPQPSTACAALSLYVCLSDPPGDSVDSIVK